MTDDLLDLDLGATAELSPLGTYRYDLTRKWVWGGDRHVPTLLWIMLNPSTADALEDDPTIRRCINFSKREGFGRMAVVNLFALRATDPKALLDHADPIGPRNQQVIRQWMADPSVSGVVAAWGAWWGNCRHRPPRLNVEMFAEQAGHKMVCLGTTKGGDPRHPLYVKSDQPLVPFEGET